MLINLRNALMEGKRLPYDAEVEYLATTGGQYINTSIIGSSATKVEITAYSTNTTDYMSIFGARNANYSNRPSYSIWQRSSVAGGMRTRFDYNSASSDSLAGGDWNASTVNTITKDNVSNYINGTLASTNIAHSFSLGIPFYLGTINGSGTPATYYFVGRIYSCKLWDANGTLVRDYIPVRVGQVGYLYDRVSGKLFGNAGSGDFVFGPDVVPVEYLQSTGTQWIATGLEAGRTSSSIKIAATLKFTDLSTGEHDLAGSGNAATPTMGRNGSNYFMWAKGGTTWYPTGCDTNWHKVSYTFNNPSGRVFELDGALYSGTQDNTFATGDGIHIFASGQNRYPLNCQLAKLEIWQNGVLVRKFLSVRVGTEGAMMDILTRRVYRNAGTGAFTYGNDLPYPIPAS